MCRVSTEWGSWGWWCSDPLPKLTINTPNRSDFHVPLPPFLLFLYSATLTSCQPPLGSLQWLTKESSWAWATPSSTFLLSSTKNSFKGNSTLLCSAVRRPLLFKCCVLILFLFLDPFLSLCFRSDWLGGMCLVAFSDLVGGWEYWGKGKGKGLKWNILGSEVITETKLDYFYSIIICFNDGSELHIFAWIGTIDISLIGLDLNFALLFFVVVRTMTLEFSGIKSM